MDIFTILILPFQEHKIPFYFILLTLISFITVLQFSEYRAFTSLVKFILRFFFKDHGIQSHQFMAEKWRNSGNRGRLYFLGEAPKITADGDCSHEIKRLLLLERKVVTNLDSIDITLPTEVHLVKAMVFPAVTYGCESWTLKKAECQ